MKKICAFEKKIERDSKGCITRPVMPIENFEGIEMIPFKFIKFYSPSNRKLPISVDFPNPDD